MHVMYQRCSGIDVHVRFLVVCLSIIEAGQRRKEIRSFRHETADLLTLRARQLQEGCAHVGMESTGGLLAAGVSTLGRALRTGGGKCSTYQNGTGPQNGRARRRMDCRRVAEWALGRQLRTQPRATRVARSNSATYQPGSRGGDQIVSCCQRCDGQIGTSHSRSAVCRRE